MSSVKTCQFLKLYYLWSFRYEDTHLIKKLQNIYPWKERVAFSITNCPSRISCLVMRVLPPLLHIPLYPFYNQIEMWKPWLARGQGPFIINCLGGRQIREGSHFFLEYCHTGVTFFRVLFYPLLKPYVCVEVRVSLRLFYNSN